MFIYYNYSIRREEINTMKSWEVNIDDTTPAMRQYLEIKRKYPGILLWYRMGDFYETFFEDAEIMSKELELTLTARDSGAKIGRVPLAGIPVKAADAYLQKLVQKSIKVIICDQLEDPKTVKGNAIVKRGITRIITAGTLNTFKRSESESGLNTTKKRLPIFKQCSKMIKQICMVLHIQIFLPVNSK